MRVCDWIAEYLYNQGVRNVHGLMGGGASGLNDGFIKNGKLKYICYHHEQGAGHAAIGESKFTGKIAVVNPTTGCAGTNCATSVLDAYHDSVPVLFLSGNVRLATCTAHINNEKNLNLRKYGIQEQDITKLYEPITKASFFIDDVKKVQSIIEHALEVATNDRPGPVWVDIPGDIQTAEMPELVQSYGSTTSCWMDFDGLTKLKEQLSKAKRPIVLAGYGIRQSNTVNEFQKFITRNDIPFVRTYGACDLMPYTDKHNIGAVGIKGSRAGNFALQNADLILAIGTSLNASVIGYDPSQFNPTAYKVAVDIDSDELMKNIIKLDLPIHMELKSFFASMSSWPY